MNHAVEIKQSPKMQHKIVRSLTKIWLSKWLHSLIHTPTALISLIMVLIIFLGALLTPWIAPHDPYDMTLVNLMEAQLPPFWMEGGSDKFLLGTDSFGRCLLSIILYGIRTSLLVGFLSVLLAVFLGVTLGLVSGYLGGWIDAVIMRAAEIQMTIPALLLALMINGLLRGVLSASKAEELSTFVLVICIGIGMWAVYGRMVRSQTLVEINKEYVKAARIMGIHPFFIMLKHVLPNVLNSVLVIGTMHIAFAILAESTLSYLGVGTPPTEPSLGTLINIGNEYIFSGEWWITLFPGIALLVLVLTVNIFGDWLRDELNPKLK